MLEGKGNGNIDKRKFYQKSTGAWSQIWDLIKPLLLFYVGYFITYFVVISIIAANGMTSVPQWLTSVLGGICMLGGVGCLYKLIVEERGCQQNVHTDSIKPDCWRGKYGAAIIRWCILILLAVSSAIVLNWIFTITGFMEKSQSYQSAANNLYAAPFAIGLFMYGIVIPLAEETVFRYLLYNRLKRFSGKVWFGAFASAFLFGMYHGNMVQAVYAFLLGLLLAFSYEYFHNIIAAMVFHGAANLVIYVCSMKQQVYEVVFSKAGIALTAVIAIACITIAALESKKKVN